jgi:hypothetical protein
MKAREQAQLKQDSWITACEMKIRFVGYILGLNASDSYLDAKKGNF